MVTRREAAQRLDIPLEMAERHGIPTRLSEAELDALDTEPPAWLKQSRANRTGRKAVWVELVCSLCGRSQMARPKKWWPEFTHLSCDDHSPDELPPVPPGMVRSEYDGVGSRFVGVVDVEIPSGG